MQYPYFAYGSNMSEARLSARVGPVERVPGPILLRGYELRFSLGRPDDGKANIHRVAGQADAHVEGVLYMLSETQLAELDKYEHVPTHYVREEVELLCGEEQRAVRAITYVVVPPQLKEGLVPSVEYVGHLITGGLENALSLRFWAGLSRAAGYAAYYVAYGRDMVPGLLEDEAAVGPLVHVGPARLPGWAVEVHHAVGVVAGEAQGEVHEDGRVHLEGLVFALTAAQLEALDRLHASHRRTRTMAPSAILQASGASLPPVVLHTLPPSASPPALPAPPSRSSAATELGQAIYGARKAGLSERYVRHMEALATSLAPQGPHLGLAAAQEGKGEEAEVLVIFVYGTLLSGLCNHHLMEGPGVEFVGAGCTSTRFRMFEKGVPYVRSAEAMGAGTEIVGEAYRVDCDALARLDELEGHPHWYVRTPIEVVLDAGGCVKAQMYLSDGMVGGKEIVDGDYRRHLLKKKAEVRAPVRK